MFRRSGVLPPKRRPNILLSSCCSRSIRTNVTRRVESFCCCHSDNRDIPIRIHTATTAVTMAAPILRWSIDAVGIVALQHRNITTMVRNIDSKRSTTALQLLQQPFYHCFSSSNISHRTGVSSVSRLSTNSNINNNNALRRCFSTAELFYHRRGNLFHHICCNRGNSHRKNNSSDKHRDSKSHCRTSVRCCIQTSTTKPSNGNNINETVNSQQGVSVTTTNSDNATTNNNSADTNMSSSKHSPVDEGQHDQSRIQQQQQPPQSSNDVVQHWLQQLRAIPNIITVSRILLIPFISYWIIQHQTMLAFIGCVYAAISDVLDGYIARRYPSMQTSLGTYLDPLGTVCCLFHNGSLSLSSKRWNFILTFLTTS